MGSNGATPTQQVYEDFVPTTELVQEQDSDTLLLDLTGFKKEQVRIQLTRTGILKISGQRPVAGDNKWLRFQKDFPVSQNCDKTKIGAKFENGILYVKQPKLITSSDKIGQELPTSDAQQPKKPADEPQPTPQKKDKQQTEHEPAPTPTTTEDKPQPTPQKKDKQQTEREPAPTPTTTEGEPQPTPQKKDKQQTEREPAPTATTTEELPKHQATNADKPEKQEPNKKDTKNLAENTPDEKTGASSTVENGNRPSNACKLENNANIGAVAVLAEKLKMPRKLMNMTLIALLVLVIGLYISNMMKSNK